MYMYFKEHDKLFFLDVPQSLCSKLHKRLLSKKMYCCNNNIHWKQGHKFIGIKLYLV